MSGDQEHSGDYGYDLAHEVNLGLDDIPRRPRAVPLVTVTAAATAAPFAVDLYGDLGYDSAHEGGS